MILFKVYSRNYFKNVNPISITKKNIFDVLRFKFQYCDLLVKKKLPEAYNKQNANCVHWE